MLGIIFRQIIAPYAYTVRRFEVVSLDQARSVKSYDVSHMTLIIDYILYWLTGHKYLWYKPIQIDAAQDLAAFEQANSSSVVVLITTYWNGRRIFTVYRCVRNIAQLYLKRMSGRWDMGGILFACITASNGIECNITTDLHELLPGAAALTSRELVVMLFCMRSISVATAVSILASSNVCCCIVLDKNLRDMIVHDGFELHDAECVAA